MNLRDLAGIDWSAYETTTDWTRLLGDLLALVPLAASAAQRGELADRLDQFADHSSSDDLEAIKRLDRAARKAARALRLDDIAARVQDLQAASADYDDVAQAFGLASAALQKEASRLRAETAGAAVAALTQTIDSLKALQKASGDDARLAAAIAQAVASADQLRGLLVQPAGAPPG